LGNEIFRGDGNTKEKKIHYPPRTEKRRVESRRQGRRSGITKKNKISTTRPLTTKNIQREPLVDFIDQEKKCAKTRRSCKFIYLGALEYYPGRETKKSITTRELKEEPQRSVTILVRRGILSLKAKHVRDMWKHSCPIQRGE